MDLTFGAIDWYAARATGIAAYVLLTFVVLLGLAMSGDARSRHRRRFPVEDVRRFGTLLVGWLVALHVLTIAIGSHLRLWTGSGIVAAGLLVAVVLTARHRRRLSETFWRHAHSVNIAVWTAATLHGLRTGTDRNATWLFTFYSASAAAVVALALRRTARPRGRVIVVGAIAAVLAVAFVSALPGGGPEGRHAPPAHGLVKTSAVRSSPSAE